jgi:hypothetical protein
MRKNLLYCKRSVIIISPREAYQKKYYNKYIGRHPESGEPNIIER